MKSQYPFAYAAGLLGALTLLASGCVKRTILIESDPPGAKVWINERSMEETTPLTYEFITHGCYTFRLQKSGFREVTARETVKAPVYQWFPLDFIFEFFIPAKLEDKHLFKYTLEPQPVEEHLMVEEPQDRKTQIAQLSDPDPAVRQQACINLAKARDASAAEGVLVATRDSVAAVRQFALIALRSIQGKQAMEPLVAALASDPDPEVRWQAAVELEALYDPKAVPALIKALKDRHPLVRAGAAEALKSIPDPQAVKPLILALRDSDTTVRRAAAEGLGLINDPTAVRPLTRVLFHKDFQTRRRAAQSLRTLKDPSSAQALVKAFNDWDPVIRQTALHAVVEIGNPEVVPRLIRYLRSWRPHIRQHAAEALGGLEDPRAVKPLRRAAAREPNEVTRDAMARALAKLGGE